jgi:uncharacterized membrane protein YfcA
VNAPTPEWLLLVAFSFLLAGCVKGLVGLGLPTVAIALLGLAMPPAQAAALLVLPSLVTNLWQLCAGPALLPLSRRLWSVLLGVCLGAWVGRDWINDGGRGAGILLGSALIIYALLGLSTVRLVVPSGAERWLGMPVGLTTGMLSAATGVFALPAVPYLQALGLQKDELVQALGLSFTVSTLALAAALAAGGALQPQLAAASLLALLPALAGMFVGQRLRARIGADAFRRYFFLGLLLLGAHLVLRQLF